MRWQAPRMLTRTTVVPVKTALLAAAVMYLHRSVAGLDRRVTLLESGPMVEPWTVVATQQRYGPRGAFFAIEYIAPNGDVVRWEREIPSATPIDPGDILRCWSSARVGEPLPHCAREPGYAELEQLLA